MAVTSDGVVLFNLAHLLTPDDVRRLRVKLGDIGGVVFVGVEVPRRLRHRVRREVRDVLDDVVGRVGPEVRRG